MTVTISYRSALTEVKKEFLDLRNNNNYSPIGLILLVFLQVVGLAAITLGLLVRYRVISTIDLMKDFNYLLITGTSLISVPSLIFASYSLIKAKVIQEQRRLAFDEFTFRQNMYNR